MEIQFAAIWEFFFSHKVKVLKHVYARNCIFFAYSRFFKVLRRCTIIKEKAMFIYLAFYRQKTSTTSVSSSFSKKPPKMWKKNGCKVLVTSVFLWRMCPKFEVEICYQEGTMGAKHNLWVPTSRWTIITFSFFFFRVVSVVWD